jgi:hypothetical protein
LSKKRKTQFKDFHFIYKLDKRGENIEKFLKGQKNKSQSIELALLFAIKRFGYNDLLNSLEDWILENNLDPYSVLKSDKSKPVTKIIEANKEEKQHKPDAERIQSSKPHQSNSNKRKDKKVTKVENNIDKKSNNKLDKKSEKAKDSLSTDDINKILWDGNSSSL